MATDLKLRYIHCDASRCTGCRTCELACSAQHEHVFSPARARVRMRDRGLNPIAIACRHCPEAPCIDACPLNARRKRDRLTIVDETKCVGCGLCIEQCPFEATVLHPTRHSAMVCDLCNGEETPACIKACVQDALTLKEAAI